eukprot:5944633-Pyramimonas_sp.AAC.1
MAWNGWMLCENSRAFLSRGLRPIPQPYPGWRSEASWLPVSRTSWDASRMPLGGGFAGVLGRQWEPFGDLFGP